MSFTLNTRRIDKVIVLDLTGRLTIGQPVILLRDLLVAHLTNGERKFLLNLADIAYIDSSGLGALVWAHVSTRNQGGDVKLLNLTSKVKDLLQITKLVT